MLALLFAVPAGTWVADAYQKMTLTDREKALVELSETRVRIENEKLFYAQANAEEERLISLLGEAQAKKRGAGQAANGLRANAQVLLKRYDIPCEEIFPEGYGVCDFQRAE